MYDEAMLPGGLMVDNMIEGLPSFPPTFEDHSGIYNGSCNLVIVHYYVFIAPKINIQTPPKSPHHQLTDDYCDADPSFLTGGHLDSLLVPPPHYQKSIDIV